LEIQLFPFSWNNNSHTNVLTKLSEITKLSEGRVKQNKKVGGASLAFLL